MSNYIVIDIGGTYMKYGLAAEDGTFKQRGKMPTRAKTDGADGIVEKCAGIAKEYLGHFYADGIGISTAGIVNPQEGSIVFAGEGSFPGYTGTQLGARVAEAAGLPCIVENDANAAAVGEGWRGAAKGAASAFVMMVGTGVGGALLLDGRPYHGAGYSSGEAGFMRVHGEHRIFEELASTRAMLQEAAFSHNVSPAELTGEQVFAWARQGDADAIAAIAHFADNLAEGVANITVLLNPAVFVLGGGVMAQQAILGPRIQQRVEQLVPEALRQGTRLAFARLGNDACLYGMLKLLLDTRK